MLVSTYTLIVSLVFIDLSVSATRCHLDYDRYRRSYGYSMTFHCQNLTVLSAHLVEEDNISEKKLPLKISSSPNLVIRENICGDDEQEYLLGLLIESSNIRSIGNRAFSCRTLRVLSITQTYFPAGSVPDDIFVNAYQLQTIRFSQVNLQRLPKSLELLSNLTELVLDDMHSLVTYPSIEHLLNLRYFHIFTSLNYFPLHYIDNLNSLVHIQVVHFGSRTIDSFPRELFHLNGYQLTDVSLYSENITCQTCKSDWFKTIVKTLMINGWLNRTKEQFSQKNVHLITTTTFVSLII